MKLVIVGCGKMGSAIARGVVRSASWRPADMQVLDVNPGVAHSLRSELGISATSDTGGPRLVVIATKPDAVEAAVSAYDWTDGDVLLSVAAGIEVFRLQGWTSAPVVRAMPNTPAEIGLGVTGIYFSKGITDEGRSYALRLVQAVGTVVELSKESDFDVLTALSGSGPAYVFLFAEALIEAAVEQGLSRQMAATLALETIHGASALARQSSSHLAQLRADVTSPGGTTAAGLAALEKMGFRAALREAIVAASGRSREMGEN